MGFSYFKEAQEALNALSYDNPLRGLLQEKAENIRPPRHALNDRFDWIDYVPVGPDGEMLWKCAKSIPLGDDIYISIDLSEDRFEFHPVGLEGYIDILEGEPTRATGLARALSSEDLSITLGFDARTVPSTSHIRINFGESPGGGKQASKVAVRRHANYNRKGQRIKAHV